MSETVAQPQNKRRRALILLASIFIVIGIIWALYWLIWGRFAEYTDDAYVNGNVVQLMPQVSGTVIEINTDETQLVTQGQPIIKLDPTDSEIRLQQAASSLANTIRQVKKYYEDAQRADSLFQLRRADYVKAALDVKRRNGLVGKRAISAEEMQHYSTALKTARASLNSAYHAYRAALALVENTYLYTHPLVEKAKAVYKSAYLAHKRVTVTAPVTGFVAKRNVQVGQQVGLQSAMLAIVPLNQIWIDANYKESQLGRIRIHQPVTVYADAYPNIAFHGKILGLSPGTGASFSLLPPQNATGNWIKIVQRLPVRVALDPEEIKRHPLLIGLSMEITTDTHNLKGDRLAKLANIKPLYITNVYNHQLAEAQRHIEQILHATSQNLFFPSLTVEHKQ